MSEQKMPALPSPDARRGGVGEPYWTQASVERIQREAYEACDRQWRKRLEPLRVAFQKLEDAAPLHGPISAAEMYASAHVIATVRTLFEENR